MAEPYETTRQECKRRWKDMTDERASWEPQWKDIAQYIRPGAYQANTSESGKGIKRGSRIINNTPIRASNTLASGMMSGITSPSRQWFRLTTGDTSISEVSGVRGWLDYVTRVLLETFAGSNFYTALHTLYFDLADIGTGVMFMEEDTEEAIRCYVWTPGTYVLAASDRGQIDTAGRQISMTVANVVGKFGYEKCSQELQAAYDEDKYQKRFNVMHMVYPNEDYNPRMAGPKGMRWKSCWFEEAGDDRLPCLRESGYHEFPVMAPRWTATESVYGRGPGLEALDDSKSLQLLERQKARMAQKIVDPPMNAPMSMMTQRASLVPGDVNYIAETGSGTTFKPVYEIDHAAIQVAEGACREVENRIRETYYVPLWLSMTDSDRRQITAEEIRARQQEKMQMLGPVMERLDPELLAPIILRAVAILARGLKLPPPPKELKGKFKIEYLSILAQAQKLVGTTSIERLLQFTGQMAQAGKPEAMDKLNTDEMVDAYADAVGAATKLVLPDDQVSQIRKQRAQAQQQQQQMAMAQAQATHAQTLSQTDTGGDNALTQLAGALPGVAQAGIGQA